MPIIYPSIGDVGFQALKSTGRFNADHDDWFYRLHKNTRLYELILSDANNFFKTINSKYFTEKTGQPTGFQFYNNNYLIGNITDFQQSRY